MPLHHQQSTTHCELIGKKKRKQAWAMRRKNLGWQQRERKIPGAWADEMK
jgi:hypothetical protein